MVGTNYSTVKNFNSHFHWSLVRFLKSSGYPSPYPHMKETASFVIQYCEVIILIFITQRSDGFQPFDFTSRSWLVSQEAGGADFEIIPDICYRRHRRRLCKFFLPGVNFSRLNAKNLLFNCIMWHTVYNLACGACNKYQVWGHIKQILQTIMMVEGCIKGHGWV